MIRFLISLHRWLGVALCLLFFLWFPSGIGMMYWGMPSVTARDRLDRLPTLTATTVASSLRAAAEAIGSDAPLLDARLTSFDGRPAYRFGAGGRGGAGGRILYADTGEEHGSASRFQRGRLAAAWTGQPESAATVEAVNEPDQWIVGTQLRNLRPLWKYSWPNGDEVYLGDSGEVLQHTTSTTRLQAYSSAVPRWLYFTPLRKHQPVWIRVTTYAAMVGTVGALVGVVLGAWLYSPRKKYRYAGAPSRIPYRGAKRWHTVAGLVFGVATVTWTLSGSLAFLPFPAPQRAPSQERALRPTPGRPPGGQPGRGRGFGAVSLASTLRGTVPANALADLHPRTLLTRHSDLAVKEISFTAFDGKPFYSLSLADGTSRIFSLDGRRVEAFDRDRIVELVRSALPTPRRLEVRTVEQYDYYYLDRTRQRPLPTILALTHDADQTRYYIDPATATVVGTFSNRNWARRFFYNGLHSLSFPWLYNRRPLWDVVVIGFMLGGTALCATSLVLAWRAVGKALRSGVASRRSQPAPLSAPAHPRPATRSSGRG